MGHAATNQLPASVTDRRGTTLGPDYVLIDENLRRVAETFPDETAYRVVDIGALTFTDGMDWPMPCRMRDIYQPKFDVDRWLKLVEAERPVAVFLVPAMAHLHPGATG
jgi:hypothetical protein